MHRRRSAVFIEKSACLRAPCPPLTTLAAGVLTFTHLARLLKKPRLREAFMAFPAGVLTCAHLTRRLLHLRRGCSHSRTLPAVHFPYGGSAHIHAPCPPFTSLTAAVLTLTHLARRSLPLRRQCSLSRTLKAHHSGALLILGVPGGSRTHDLSLKSYRLR